MSNDQYTRIKSQGGPYDSLIQTAASTHGVNYDLLHKQLFLESSFNPNAKSPTGPRGIGQFTKATGKAYGLVNEEDFYDPAKSIDAAARHMKDNLKLAGGDELKALLAYNQGGGRLGKPQLEAYDRGDFGSISEEGRNYMAKLADVAKVGKTTELTDFVKPKSDSVEQGAIPFNGSSMHMGGKDVPEKAKGFRELL
ncbi:MAG TPA: transglycosylase, partial [Gemmatimonadetes bacterium]|nr:transglycosylase [Gemmatimonadota bacterium]